MAARDFIAAVGVSLHNSPPMLKALELVGFKSFADATRFEFPAGITVVVGPNGSGKSNIVDGIKWVLGEQSAKSLRGAEMADVIFKGGDAAGRRVVNTAEATIVIDNSAGRLPIDAPEVHVTRRVYRSGEGEYLINRQPCRLKDVRDLFRGSGVGTDAYSLIEQGKVDRLLQASSRERRAIFEEAAGISRFKAKKIEAQRRLERVDQNLLRLSDIVQEVENRLRSVRAQASKARRYREHSERLQQLRIQVGLTDWRSLTDQLEAEEGEIQNLRRQADELATQSEAIEAHSLELETEIATSAEHIRNCENQLAANREDVAGHELTIEHERARRDDLEEEARARRQQLLLINTRAGDLHERLRATTSSLNEVESEYAVACQRLAEHEQAFEQVSDQFNESRQGNEQRRNQYMTRLRDLSALGNELSSLQARLAALVTRSSHHRSRLAEIDTELAPLDAELEQSRIDEERLRGQTEQLSEQLEALRLELAESRRLLIRRQEDIAERQGRLSGLSQRAAVLEELERKAEGVSAGARELMARAARDSGGPLSEVKGLVADVVRAPVEIAPLVDVALGPAAQYVILSGDQLIQQIESGSIQTSGRVGIVRRQPSRPLREPRVDLDGRPGVIGRADRAVAPADGFAAVARQLLGRTWFVESLNDALALAAVADEHTRFVTRQGHLLDADGALTLGSARPTAGLVSRRSQLRQLKSDITALETQVAEAQEEVRRLRVNLDRQEHETQRRGDELEQFANLLADQKLNSRSLVDRISKLRRERDDVAGQLREVEQEKAQVSEASDERRERLGGLETDVAEMEKAIRTEDALLEELDAQRVELTRQATAAKVDVAKTEQRLDGLRSQKEQFEERHRERHRAADDTLAELGQIERRGRRAEREILHATSALAELYLRKETFHDEITLRGARRQELAESRNELQEQLQQRRKEIHGLEERVHERDLAAGQLRHQRAALEDRIREDYGIELERVDGDESEGDQAERESVEQEIADLRRKISRIGPVSMDALDELDSLETRFESLAGQHRDLTEAKQALERIIQKINADSRRLFVETLEIIRQNFQGLFRKSFGGGRADIVLEEGVDVLEAGVEIVATPPGKPSFSNSLLSGGEKALTAVALLLAIFQFRPSPFCVLDEVDAPFDEANIGRFIEVLKGFLGWTKFVIVTHSKKTMTAATTLYGVTMQESGVSKQVSVRFEDVSDDGEIRPEAIARESAQGGDDDERGAA